MRLAKEPEDEVSVGTAAKVFTLAHQIAPGFIESIMAKQTHKAVIEKAQPEASSDGSVNEPAASGAEIRGGWQKEKK